MWNSRLPSQHKTLRLYFRTTLEPFRPTRKSLPTANPIFNKNYRNMRKIKAAFYTLNFSRAMKQYFYFLEKFMTYIKYRWLILIVNFTFFAGHRRGIRRPLKCGEISQSQSHLRYEDLRKDILLDGTFAGSHEGLGRCHIHRSRRISRVPMKYKLSNRARRAL